ncbi:MAG: hypothetical protein R2838_15345 [Caldilineaceae bacterium]
MPAATASVLLDLAALLETLTPPEEQPADGTDIETANRYLFDANYDRMAIFVPGQTDMISPIRQEITFTHDLNKLYNALDDEFEDAPRRASTTRSCPQLRSSICWPRWLTTWERLKPPDAASSSSQTALTKFLQRASRRF